MTSRTIRITVSAIVALLLAASIVGGFIMTDRALLPNGRSRDLEQMKAKWEKRVPGLMQWYDSLRVAGIFRDTVITAPDGVSLHAVYAPAVSSQPATTAGQTAFQSSAGQTALQPSDGTTAAAAGTAVLVHGYTDNHLSMVQVARLYRDSLNFNVLLVDNRYHGLSGGDHIQMGWKDRFDLKLWLPVSHDIFGNDFTVVHGISMGGAATMMLSGEPDLPAYVRAFIDDCGYSSVWDQFKFILKTEYHLPVFPILPVADLICKLRYGWGFKEASSVDQLRKSTAPVFFIHGHEDDYVPTENVVRCYNAKVDGFKDIWLTPSTIHARSCIDQPAEYAAHVGSFLSLVKEL